MPHREKHAAHVEPAVGTPTREIGCENPVCGRAFHVPDALVGHAVRCPHCQCEMRAPGAVEKPALPGSQRWFRVRIRSGPAFEDREFELDPARSYCIGRSDEAEIHLPGEHVSRRHSAASASSGISCPTRAAETLITTGSGFGSRSLELLTRLRAADTLSAWAEREFSCASLFSS
ncbi:MAG: FHA domain-containing protein [Planctomycetes bacterium]|nr:FHA domain-containing protein [Planctomycetota bacterium]